MLRGNTRGEELFMSEEIKTETPEVNTSAEEKETSGISKSKAKREARKAEVKSAKVKKNIDSIIAWVLGIAIAALVIFVIAMGIFKSVNTTTSSSDFSEGLTEEGYIDGANLNKVTDLGMESLVIPYSEVEYTDEEVESDIQSALSAHAYYDDDTSLTVADGDTINLDYTGYMDGTAFDGGSAEGAELTIGSGSFIDDFEDQLIGYHPGDSVTVEVTFPDDYSSTDLAGKDATFECVINSIEVTPELTDEFVAEYYSEYASTVDELYAYAKEQGYESNLNTYITDYIEENASVSSYPGAYVKHLKSVFKYQDEQMYSYYNSYYYQYLGSYLYDSFESYTGMSDTEYEKSLKTEAKAQAAVDMTYESIYKNAGLSISDDLHSEILELFGGDDAVSTYGDAYLNQVCIKYAVVYYLAEKVTVEQ